MKKHNESKKVQLFPKSVKAKGSQNILEFSLKVFAKLNILKETAWKSDIYF